MDVSGTVELITESGSLISVGDIIAIIVAMISLVGVIITTVMTNKTTKKINKENIELQDKWNQKNIDANLIAQARIEWIQNVRKVTSELLTHYFSMINSENLENIDQELLVSQEKNELLILYFGNDVTQENTTGNIREKLLCKENNIGKNDLLVRLLEDLAKQFSGYAKDVKKGRYKYLEEAIRQSRKEMYDNVRFVEIGVEYTEDGDEIPVTEPQYEDDDVISVRQAEMALQTEKNKIELMQKDLILLRDAIRTYLKIEWEIAKKGK